MLFHFIDPEIKAQESEMIYQNYMHNLSVAEPRSEAPNS